jgi:hypothetical protein
MHPRVRRDLRRCHVKKLSSVFWLARELFRNIALFEVSYEPTTSSVRTELRLPRRHRAQSSCSADALPSRQHLHNPQPT